MRRTSVRPTSRARGRARAPGVPRRLGAAGARGTLRRLGLRLGRCLALRRRLAGRPLGDAAGPARPVGPHRGRAFRPGRRRPRTAGRAARTLRHRRQGALERTPLVRIRHAGRLHLAPGRPRVVVVALARLLRARPGLGDPGGEHELLAQRMPLEPVGQQQRHQVRVAGEVDPEHLVRLALVPAGPRVDPGGARQRGAGPRHPGAQQQVAHRSAVPDGGQVDADREALGELVHRAQPVEEAQAEPVPGGGQRLDPVLGGHVHGEQLIGLGRARPGADRGGGLLGIHRVHCAPPGPGTSDRRSAPADGPL